MKILFFIENLVPGGRERRFVELLIALKNHSNINYEIVLAKNIIHYKEVFDLKIPIHIIERRNFKKDPRLFYKFYKIAKKNNPDIIHVWGNLTAFYALPAKALLGIPMINSQIADAPAQLPKGIISYRLTFPFSDLIIANSKAGLESYKPPAEKSLVIHNGFDLKRIQNLKSTEEVKDKFAIKTNLVVGMVAEFSKLKDYTTYIKAALIVLNKIENVTFICVGAGDKSEHKKLVPTNLSEKIIFIEPQLDILSLMNVCNIGVLSTFTEGISNAIMEFMALGKPVVATDGGGTTELVVDSETGYLVESESEAVMSEKIITLLNDNLLQEDMGENGMRRIQKDFSMNSMIASFKREYLKMAKK